jgi:cytochrome c biogenesis protein CcdA
MLLGTLGLAFLAGILSILSPCVLPLLPIVFGTAASDHRNGPVALGGGVAVSFVAIGLFVATIGFGLGLDGALFRKVAAMMMIGSGLFLMLPTLQLRLAAASGPISNWADQRRGNVRSSGLAGQFGIGVLLGAVWSPCVGPTLGAASVLAAQGSSLGVVTLTMLVFGIGAAVPLIAIGLVSRQALATWRNRLISGGKTAKVVLGALLLTLGILIASGLDKRIETALVDASPAWLTALTTRF